METLRTQQRRADIHKLVREKRLHDKRDIKLLNKVLETIPNKEWDILLEHILEDNAVKK